MIRVVTTTITKKKKSLYFFFDRKLYIIMIIFPIRFYREKKKSLTKIYLFIFFFQFLMIVFLFHFRFPFCHLFICSVHFHKCFNFLIKYATQTLIHKFLLNEILINKKFLFNLTENEFNAQ